MDLRKKYKKFGHLCPKLVSFTVILSGIRIARNSDVFLAILVDFGKIKAMKTKRRFIRIGLRVLIFIGLAVFIAIAGSSKNTAQWFAGLSPIAFLSDVITRREIPRGILVVLLPMVMLIFALFKGDVFCRWICPAGFLLRFKSRLSPRKQLVQRPYGGYLFWALTAGALAGAPFLLFLDPLSMFNRLVIFFQIEWSLVLLIPVILLPVLMVLCFIQPRVWCARLCPLGYLLRLIRIKKTTTKPKDGNTRRQVIIGVCSGLAISFLGRKLGISKSSGASTPIMPPGAGDSETFSGLCSRCYNCVNICPQNIIRLNTDPRDGIARLLVPEISYTNGYCDDLCSQCSNVCPTGALKPLPLAQKRNIRMGTATVEHERCFAWARGQECMICADSCPYDAIRSDTRADGLRRPEVQTGLCRGCGKCQLNCPSGPDRKAIRVSGLHRQRPVTEAGRNYDHT